MFLSQDDDVREQIEASIQAISNVDVKVTRVMNSLIYRIDELEACNREDNIEKQKLKEQINQLKLNLISANQRQQNLQKQILQQVKQKQRLRTSLEQKKQRIELQSQIKMLDFEKKQTRLRETIVDLKEQLLKQKTQKEQYKRNKIQMDQEIKHLKQRELKMKENDSKIQEQKRILQQRCRTLEQENKNFKLQIQLQRQKRVQSQKFDGQQKFYQPLHLPTFERAIVSSINNRITKEIPKKNRIRAAICFEGTHSKPMQKVFDQVNNTVLPNLLSQLNKGIQLSKIQVTIQIQLVIYRNYSSRNTILEYSEFESQTNKLEQWFKKRELQYVQDTEAVEVCLQYLNRIEGLNQFIIVADSRGNPKSYIQSNRKQSGEDWDKLGFPSTSTDQQLEKLKDKGVKGHSLYLEPESTKEFFEDLSFKTGGKAKQLKVSIQDENLLGKQITDFIAETILQNVDKLAFTQQMNYIE